MLRRGSVVAAGLSVLVGAVVLVGGWGLGIAPLRGLLPGLDTVKANTALCFVLSGAALWILRDETASRRSRAVALAATAAAGLIAGLTLVEYLTGLDLRIDELLVADPLTRAQGLPAGRMPPSSALCFLLIAIALFALDRPALFRTGQRLAVASGFIAFLSVVAHTYNVQRLRLAAFPIAYTDVAPVTAIVLVVLSVAVTAARVGRGATGIFVQRTAGGTIARWLLPAAIFGPFILGSFLLVGERQGYYTIEFGLALVVVANLSLFTAMVWWIAVRLHRADAGRLRAEASLRQVNADLEAQVTARTARLAESEARYRQLIEQSPDGILIHQAGSMRFANRAAARLFGYERPDDMVGQALASHLAPEGRETVLGRIEARIRGDAVPVANEVEALRRDGSRVWLEAAAALVEWEGEPATLVCCTDVSERRRRVAAEREADSLRSVTMLANAAAHEINNPLTIIAGNVQLLGGKLSERADLQDHVRRTERAVQRIVEMVGHMQHITRLEPLADLDTGSVPTLDIRRSAGPAPGGGPADPGPSAT